MALVSIHIKGAEIEIVDQLLLPHVTVYVPINSPDDAYDAIKSMKIRGAPAIASLAALSISSYLSKAIKQSPPPPFLSSLSDLRNHLDPILKHLYSSRPTAVNLGVAVKRLYAVLDDADAQNKAVLDTVDSLIKEGRAVADEDVGRNKEMSRIGGEWIKEQAKAKGQDISKGLNILTVCNTGSLATSGYGTALGVITYLHETGSLSRAYFTQSTPYHQGSRLTALELKTLNIPSTMLCDSMVGSLLQHHEIHAIAVGADRVARNGDTANKVGTYNAAVLAARHNVPFVIVAPVSTLDLNIPDGDHIPIEHRPPIEACQARGVVVGSKSDNPVQAVVQITPDLDLEGGGVYNPSFDVTPADLISAVVTEKGVASRLSGANTIDVPSVS